MIRLVDYPIILRPTLHLLWSVVWALVTRRVVRFDYPVAVRFADEAEEKRVLQ